jgi:hypothetical protein
MVLLDRIELSTSPLPMECSTTELQQRRAAGRRNGIADTGFPRSGAILAIRVSPAQASAGTPRMTA